MQGLEEDPGGGCGALPKMGLDPTVVVHATAVFGMTGEIRSVTSRQGGQAR